MRKFSINIWGGLHTYYNHYLSSIFIEKRCSLDNFKEDYPLELLSRKIDKPSFKHKDGTCFWVLDDKDHRIGKPARIWADGRVAYWVNGEVIK